MARRKFSMFSIMAVAGAFLAAETCLANQQPPRKGGRAGAMMKLISAIDSDGDGTISAAEIAAASANLKALDQDGDGAVTADELRPDGGAAQGPNQRAGRRNRPGPNGQQGPPQQGRGLQRLQAMDTNGDGKLSADEVPERMQRMIDRFDENADGDLDQSELETMRERFEQRRGDRAGRGGKGPGGKGPGGKPQRQRPVEDDI